MLGALGSGLTDSSREALSVSASVLVAFALGVIIQGRVVDEHVDPPHAVRACLVAVEILVAGIFFIAAAVGVFACLYYLAADRTPAGRDRALVENALLSSALLAFVLTIARRALPACWPSGPDRPDDRAIALARWGALVGSMLVLCAASAVVAFDPLRLFLVVAALAVCLALYMLIGFRIEFRSVNERRTGRRLARQGAWLRVEARATERGGLDGATGLPAAFVPASQAVGDPRLWLSSAGVERIRALLREQGRSGDADLVLRRQGRKRIEMMRLRGEPAIGVQVFNAVVMHRSDAGLYLVEPVLGLIERKSPGVEDR
jgi:hypothetical protein